MEKENLIYFGDAVKVLGEGRVGGYLVRYSTDRDPDLVGDFFTKDSDLGVEAGSRVPVYYQHGYDPVLKSRRLGRAEVEYQDIGIWLEAQLEMRDEYERGLMELAEAGKLGWSSGAAGHLVEREQVGKSWHITSWPIAEASLTPTPAEPRNTAISVKSLYNVQEPEGEPEHNQEVIMTDEKVQEVVQEQPDFEALIKTAVDAAVLEMKKQEPQVKAGVQVTEDEADRQFRGSPVTAQEFFKAV